MVYKEISKVIDKQDTAALCVLVQTKGSTPRLAGSKMLVYPDGQISGTIGGGELEHRVIQEALDVIKNGKPRLFSYKMTEPKEGDPGLCGGQLEVYVEPILPAKTIIVVGTGHVGRAVAKLAKWLGYYLIVSDDRPDFASPEVVPDADIYHTGSIQELIESNSVHQKSHLVLTTRGVELDSAGLPAILETEAAYIGVIGSKRRWETTRKNLQDLGVSADQISRIRSPMGLELQAETPEEIAVSILAEIIMLSNGGDGSLMKAD